MKRTHSESSCDWHGFGCFTPYFPAPARHTSWKVHCELSAVYFSSGALCRSALEQKQYCIGNSICVHMGAHARACVRACVNDWVWVWGYPKNPYSVCVFEVPEHGTRRRLSCCVCLCAGVFAVILQQLDCSLGYVYVSHLSVPLLFFPTYVSVPCLLSNQLYCCTGTVSVVNICHNSCLYCYTVQTLNTRFLRLHAGPASIWRLPSWFSRGVGSSFPLSCFVHCC